MGAQIRQRSCNLMGAIVALCVKIYLKISAAPHGVGSMRGTPMVLIQVAAAGMRRTSAAEAD
jgi:hypothetical protein